MVILSAVAIAGIVYVKMLRPQFPPPVPVPLPLPEQQSPYQEDEGWPLIQSQITSAPAQGEAWVLTTITKYGPVFLPGFDTRERCNAVLKSVQFYAQVSIMAVSCDPLRKDAP
jgi:hypothetical protein